MVDCEVVMHLEYRSELLISISEHLKHLSIYIRRASRKDVVVIIIDLLVYLVGNDFACVLNIHQTCDRSYTMFLYCCSKDTDACSWLDLFSKSVQVTWKCDVPACTFERDTSG